LFLEDRNYPPEKLERNSTKFLYYPLIQSWNRSGSPAPVRPDRTRPDEKFIRPDETGFLPDFCQCDVKNEPDGIYRIFFDFFAGFFAEFLPDFCRIDLKNDPAGFLPDWRQK
jgi:hypothetical protein